MDVLEKILEEIGATERIRFSSYTELLIAVKDVEKIIRSHMDEMPKCNNCSRREWYRIGYRDGRRINVKNIKSINKEMGDYLFEKYCVEGFDEELDKIFYKYLALGGDMDVSSNYKSIEYAEIDPVSEEFLKDCAETAAKYKRNADSWIPVEEGLPEEGQKVLVWYEYFRYGEYNRMFETYGIGWQFDGHWSGDVSGTKARCIAWHPLPEPYRQKEQKSAKNTQQEMEDFWMDK